VADGLAQVIRHRADEERAENYDDLVVAETAAKAGKKGIHSPDSPGLPRVTDLSLDHKKARTHLPFLQRQTDLRAIVEYVFAGSRFKVRLLPQLLTSLRSISLTWMTRDTEKV
jgi:staphylococcal nuclease domain-containing protein 1